MTTILLCLRFRMIEHAFPQPNTMTSTERNNNRSNLANSCLAPNVENARSNAIVPNLAQPVAHVEHPRSATSSPKEGTMHPSNSRTNYANSELKTYGSRNDYAQAESLSTTMIQISLQSPRLVRDPEPHQSKGEQQDRSGFMARNGRILYTLDRLASRTLLPM